MAVSVTLGLEQLNVALAGLLLTVGTVLSSSIVIAPAAVQQPGEVSVTEYVPVELTVIWGSVEPVDQRTVPVPTAVRLADGFAQVSTVCVRLMVRDGAV
jgi:hypothetical protein